MSALKVSEKVHDLSPYLHRRTTEVMHRFPLAYFEAVQIIVPHDLNEEADFMAEAPRRASTAWGQLLRRIFVLRRYLRSLILSEICC